MRILIAAVFILLVGSGSATADDTQEGRYYTELRGGAAFLDDLDADVFETSDARFEFKTGWLAEAALGYWLSRGVRGEFTLGYRENEVDEVDFRGDSTNLNGKLKAYNVMINVLSEFDINLNLGNLVSAADDEPLPIRPFLGFGFGGAFLDDGSDTDIVPAYQIVGGLSYRVDERWTLTASGTYFVTSRPKFDGVKTEYQSKNLLAGVRFSF